MFRAFVSAAVLVAATTTAHAQSYDQQRAYCENQGQGYSADLRIDGCTALIQSGRENTAWLAFAFNSRGNAYAFLGDYARAIADFDQAIRLDPQNARAYFSRSLAHIYLGDYARAIADYDQLIRITPQNAGFFGARCEIRGRWGQQLDQALADCETSLRIRPNDQDTLGSRALIRLRRGEFQAAFTDYDAAVRNGGSERSLYGRGIARLRLGLTAEGQADIAAAIASDAGVAAEYAGYGIRP